MSSSPYRVVSAFRHAGRLIEPGAECPPLGEDAAAKLMKAGCIKPGKIGNTSKTKPEAPVGSTAEAGSDAQASAAPPALSSAPSPEDQAQGVATEAESIASPKKRGWGRGKGKGA